MLRDLDPRKQLDLCKGIYRTQEIPSLQDLRPHGSNRSG